AGGLRGALRRPGSRGSTERAGQEADGDRSLVGPGCLVTSPDLAADATILREESMPQPPPDVKPEVLRGDLSEDLLQAYLRGPDLAIDTETMGLQTLRDRLCVVQLCDRRGRAALVQIPREALDSAPPPGERAPRPTRR